MLEHTLKEERQIALCSECLRLDSTFVYPGADSSAPFLPTCLLPLVKFKVPEDTVAPWLETFVSTVNWSSPLLSGLKPNFSIACFL